MLNKIYRTMNKLSAIIGFFFLALTFGSCSDWTETEAENIDELLADADSSLRLSHKMYLENLRAYKQTDHQMTFGWFGGWTAESPAPRYLYNLPDSTDFVSLWGFAGNMTENQKADLKKAQEEKGIKALLCFLMFQIGDKITPPVPTSFKGGFNDWQHEYWGWGSGNDEDSVNAAIVKYANAICDTIYKYNLDGFDLDAEPSYQQPFETNYEMWRPASRAALLIQTIGKRVGPMAETEEGRKKLLVVDGEPDAFPAEMGKYFNYFIIQAYNSSSYSRLDTRFNNLYSHFGSVMTREEVAKKLIVTENFEAYSANGGVAFTARDGSKLSSSYLGMAGWNPVGARKGGIGSYHMEKDYAQDLHYKYLRAGIQIMNPAFK